MNGEHCRDRITNLPNSLITKILSCLPTKEAVATCVLSTNWNQSWTSITNLDFDDHKLRYPSSIPYDISNLTKFTSFVTRVLLLRNGSFLQRLHMRCYQQLDESIVNEWLIAAVRCNIQELDLFITMNPPGQMPANIFLCRTLVVLKLDGNESCEINIPASTCLPGLKILHLIMIQLSDDVSAAILMSNFPMLEELKLCRCVGRDVRVVKITGHFLRILILDALYNDFYGEHEDHTEYEIVIDTPALEYFDFHDHIAKGYIINDMNHLVKAKISFEDCLLTEQPNSHYEAITNFLSGISHVRTLVLSKDSIWALRRHEHALPKFCSLTYLEIEAPGDPRWNVLAEVLENSPYLETLNISQGDCYTFTTKESADTFPFRNVPSGFLSHLKDIKIELFGDDMVLEVFEYILKKTPVLEKFTLWYNQYSIADFDAKFFEKLQLFLRASPICEVVVLSD